MSSQVLEFLPLLAGVVAGLGAFVVIGLMPGWSSLKSWMSIELSPLRRAFGEGRIPTLREKLRLAGLFGLGGIAAGWLVGGFTLALLAAAAAPMITAFLLARSGARYRHRVERALPDVARAVADGLAAGRSPRGALGTVHRSLEGEAGREFGRLGAELAMGVPTADAMNRLADRLDSDRVDALAVAVTSHRTTGGDLVSLLRRFADGTAERDRIADDARSSTAQARFSGYLVAGMPIVAALLVELASPGLVGSILDSPAALVLVGISATIQVIGFVAIGRLAAVSGN